MPVALAGLGEVVTALTLILLLWAARALFGGMFSSMASRIPLLGSVLRTAIDAMVADIVAEARAVAGTAISAAYGVILGPVFWIEHIIADVWDTFDAIRQVLAYITGTLIGMAVNIAVTEARVLVAGAVRQLDALVNQVYAIVQGEFHQVYTTLNAVETALVALIRAEASALTTELQDAIAAETAFVLDVEHSLSAELSAAIAAETAYVGQVEAATIAYTQAAVAGLESAISADTSAITAWVTGQVVSLSAAIDLVQAATVALTIGAVQAVEADLQNLKDDCTDNLCSGTGALASLLNQMFDTAALAALVGYAAWMGTDPRGAGRATADVLAPIASGAVDAAHAALGAL